MGMKMRIAGALLAIAASVMIWSLWSGSTRPDVPPGAGPAPAPAATVAPESADSTVANTTSKADATTPPAERSAVAVEPHAGPKATLRGRCVDAAGAPLADCLVRITGWPHDERKAAWQLDHGELPSWSEPPGAMTGSDGRFELRFWPPPPFTFTMSIGSEGRCSLSGHWQSLAEGSTTDLGDVQMVDGVTVAGRVVDEAGQPLAKQSVLMQRTPRAMPSTGFHVAQWTRSNTKDDGTFIGNGPLVPGAYLIELESGELVSPRIVDVVGQRHVELTIVAKPSQRVFITGRVLEDNGMPAAAVRVEDHSPLSISTMTAADGTFELQRAQQSNDPKARLRVFSDLYDTESTPAREVEWGARDLELRVTRAAALTLRVTDDLRKPIETYSVRLVTCNDSRTSSEDGRVRASGRHEDGVATITGLTRGAWLLIVDFPSATGHVPIFEPFQHEGGPRRMDLTTANNTGRAVRVVDGADAPIAGTQVQLCELWGREPERLSMVLNMETWLYNHRDDISLVLHEGTTDAEGRVELRGPATRELGVRALGPGHVPTELQGIRLAAGEEHVIRVARGARLSGRIVPPTAMQALARLAGFDQLAEENLPRFKLTGDGRQFPNDNLKRMSVRDDGTFDMDGLPPGVWKLVLVAQIMTGDWPVLTDLAIGQITLVDGQRTERDIDLSPFLPGRLEGTVLFNGRPAARARLVLASGGRWIGVTTDADGGFTLENVPGEYKASLALQELGRRRYLQNCSTPAVIRSGVTTQATLAFTTGRVSIAVRDAAGDPAVQVSLTMFAEGGVTCHLGPTDAAGHKEAEVDALDWTLRVLPKPLLDPAVQQKVRQEGLARGEKDPLAKHWITLTTVSIAPGQTTPVEIKLPASAGY